MDFDYKWFMIGLIGIIIAFSISDFASNKAKEKEQEILKLEIELKNKELEILKLKGKEN